MVEKTVVDKNPSERKRVWIPSEFSQAITMLIAVISAVTVFVVYFLGEAQELSAESRALREDQEDLKHALEDLKVDQEDLKHALEDLKHVQIQNTKNLNDLVERFGSIENGVVFLVCNSDQKPENFDCSQFE
ncbi:MAG: hypothetical protein OXD45_14305 [Rhodobacteraceae bacterium]|nr:hypothetical protein [Paracoccaceae bacterium]MCY4307866.1 hypothetical protein [Paracoccaceae bacterium]